MYEDMKEELDLESFFVAMGAKKLKKKSGGYVMCCLSRKHKDNSPSLHYKNETHKFFCYGCHITGDVFDILYEVKRLKLRQAIRWVKQFAGWDSDSSVEQLQAIMDRRVKMKGMIEDETQKADIILPYYFQIDYTQASDEILKYIEDRKWNIEHLVDNNIGFCLRGFFKNRIIFPVVSDDILRTFAARASWKVSEGEERYLYPSESQLSISVWGMHKKVDGVPIFVEGGPDALRLREYQHNGFACMGNQLGESKLDVIRRICKGHKDIILIPDDDNGGRILKKWFTRLRHEFNIKIGSILYNGEPIYYEQDGERKRVKDIDELGRYFGKGYVDHVIENAIPLHDLEFSNEKKRKPQIVTELVYDKSSDVSESDVYEIKKTDGRSCHRDLINRSIWSK